MDAPLSSNTKAILLLTAPLLPGKGKGSPDVLSQGEYKRLALFLRERRSEPAAFLSADAGELIRACNPIVGAGRLERLLERGFLLSQVVEHWRTRAIWVVSRADDEYPRRLKMRLREDAPAILYGAGEIGILESGGLGVVGSRQVDDALVEYTREIGSLAAGASKTLVSGGARGIDRAAMNGALEAGGRVCGVLSDSLERTAMQREHRDFLLSGRLTLVSPYDPRAGFNVGNAMQRNKLIYALSDVALVMSSDYNKGGTWAGAVEQLEKLRLVPIYVRSTGEPSEGLEMLRRRGALPWPDPRTPAELEAVLADAATARPPAPKQASLPLFGDESED